MSNARAQARRLKLLSAPRLLTRADTSRYTQLPSREGAGGQLDRWIGSQMMGWRGDRRGLVGASLRQLCVRAYLVQECEQSCIRARVDMGALCGVGFVLT